MKKMRFLIRACLIAGVAVLTVSGAGAAEGDCRHTAAVCAVRDSVFQISGYFPYGSAVRIESDLLVTNRHLVADETEVQITLTDGGYVTGSVVPVGPPWIDWLRRCAF